MGGEPAPSGINSSHHLIVPHFTDGKTKDTDLPEASQPGEQLEPDRPHVLTAASVGCVSPCGSGTGGGSSDEAGESAAMTHLPR